MNRIYASVLALIVAAPAVAGTDKTENAEMKEVETAIEKTGEEIEQSAEAAANETGEALESAETAVENTADDVANATENAAEEVEQAAENAAQETEQAAEAAAEETEQTAEAAAAEVNSEMEQAEAKIDNPIVMDNNWNSNELAKFDAPRIEREGWSVADSAAMTSEELTGMRVYDENDEWIGEIDNIIVNTSGKIEGAVVGVGGFIGIGEKDVLVSFDSLTIKRETEGGSMRAYASMTEEELEALPAYGS